jgi:ABC-type antimicrobial peptide transport system permease subunit
MRFDPDGAWHEIVGVVADFRHYEVTEPMRPAAYVPYFASLEPPRQMTLVARTDADPAALVPAIRGVLRELDTRVPLYRVDTMRQVVANQSWVERIARDLLTSFGIGAALLAVTGLYGVISYTVAQRRKEIGLRLALGATPSRVGRTVRREGLTLGVVGVVLGAGLALAASRLLTSLLFEVRPGDPPTFVAAGLVVLALVAAACHGPARRAGRMDPIAALRDD